MTDDNLEAKMCPLWNNKPKGLTDCIGDVGIPHSTHITQFMESCGDKWSDCTHYKKHTGEDKPKTPVAAAVSVASEGTNGKYTVLFVDDDLIIRMVAGKTLGKIYNLITAENGQDALEKIGEHGTPDAIITDMTMPIMTGGELIRELQARYITTPIIVITGHSTETVADLNVYAVRKKPVNFRELGTLVNQAITDYHR